MGFVQNAVVAEGILCESYITRGVSIVLTLGWSISLKIWPHETYEYGFQMVFMPEWYDFLCQIPSCDRCIFL